MRKLRYDGSISNCLARLPAGSQVVAVRCVEEDTVSTSGRATFREAPGKTSGILGFMGWV